MFGGGDRNRVCACSWLWNVLLSLRLIVSASSSLPTRAEHDICSSRWSVCRSCHRTCRLRESGMIVGVMKSVSVSTHVYLSPHRYILFRCEDSKYSILHDISTSTNISNGSKWPSFIRVSRPCALSRGNTRIAFTCGSPAWALLSWIGSCCGGS